jgi:hypothetical protein
MTILNIFVPKAQHTYVYDTEKLPASTIEYLLDNGAKQSLADTTAGLVRKEYTGTNEEFRADARKLADVRDVQIRSGQVPGLRAPMDVEAMAAAKLGLTVEVYRAVIAAGVAAVKTGEAPTESPKKKAA